MTDPLNTHTHTHTYSLPHLHIHINTHTHTHTQAFRLAPHDRIIRTEYFKHKKKMAEEENRGKRHTFRKLFALRKKEEEEEEGGEGDTHTHTHTHPCRG
jgi:hypothetical protein